MGRYVRHTVTTFPFANGTRMIPASAPLARLSQLVPGSTVRVNVAGEDVRLCNVEGAVYAIEDRCSHDTATFEEGRLEGCRIECPRHGALFDVTTGEALTFPAILPIRTYAVRVVGDDVFVDE